MQNDKLGELVKEPADIKVPDLKNLKGVFETIKESEYDGVKGVMCFDSGVEGPTVGITICTHGNEPVGLATLWHFMSNELYNDMQKGRVFFVLNNLQATENYFDATTEDEKYHARFVDSNMNRLPESLEASLSNRYEILRAQELLPIWAEFNIGLDLHSTSVPSEPMMLLRHGSGVELIKGFPIENVISGLSGVMQGNTAMDFYGTKENHAHTVLIEAGSHEEEEAFRVGIACIDAALGNVGITSNQVDDIIHEYNHYKMCSSIMFPDESYITSEIFPNFEFVSEGALLATGNGRDITATEEGHVLMCFSTGKPPSLEEEALFISLPVEKVVFDEES